MLLLSLVSFGSVTLIEKPDLIKTLEPWTPPESLDSLYSAYKNSLKKSDAGQSPSAEFVLHLEKTRPFSLRIESILHQNLSLARGDWKHPSHEKKISAWMRFQVLALDSLKKNPFPCQAYQKQSHLWLYFLAELAYSEADPQSLVPIHRWRQDFLEDIHSTVRSSLWENCEQEESLRWWKSQRFPWPIDRILMTEKQKIKLNLKETYWIQKAVGELQKNPHQSLESWFQSHHVFITPGLAQITPAWNSSMVSLMQEELALRDQILALLTQRADRKQKSQQKK
jgi:hypothetical protein